MTKTSSLHQLLAKNFDIQGSYHTDEQGKIHVDGNVISKTIFNTLPVNFAQVSGYFDCSRSGLKSLQGAPHKVGHSFNCTQNQLKSLEHGPREVGRNFVCDYNLLTSLEHGPSQVLQDYTCSNNHLRSLKGAPEKILGQFVCNTNLLTDLTYSPVHVAHFYCRSNSLNSLRGAPQEVLGDFQCHFNPLTSLEGAPQKVLRQFIIDYDENLPMLRLLMYADVIVHGAPLAVEEIMHKYEGTGRPGALKAALELIRAGHAENARW